MAYEKQLTKASIKFPKRHKFKIAVSEARNVEV